MNVLLLFLSIALAAAFFVGAFRVFRRFDEMLRQLYETDRERWTKLGSPTGYFWRPSTKTSFFSSSHSRDAMFFAFLARGCKPPNKAPEPTPRPVTDRADARSAPGRVVAHL